MWSDYQKSVVGVPSPPPTGLLTKTQPDPWAGFSRAGLGGGRVLARPSYPIDIHHMTSMAHYIIIPEAD
jgi:hypothetical protein